MNQTNLIYFALAACIGITALPWIISLDVLSAADFLMGLIAIICAFLGGMSWSWQKSNPTVGILISFFALLAIFITNIFVAHIILASLLNIIWWYEKRCMSSYLEETPKYKKAREIATYVLTICILISGTLVLNPY